MTSRDVGPSSDSCTSSFPGECSPTHARHPRETKLGSPVAALARLRSQGALGLYSRESRGTVQAQDLAALNNASYRRGLQFVCQNDDRARDRQRKRTDQRSPKELALLPGTH